MHLARYADQGSKFLQCIVIGDATWVNHTVRETKQKNHDVQTTVIFFCKEIQSSAVSKESYGNCFLGHNGVFLPYFIDRRDTANVERYCNKQGSCSRPSVAKGLGDSAND